MLFTGLKTEGSVASRVGPDLRRCPRLRSWTAGSAQVSADLGQAEGALAAIQEATGIYWETQPGPQAPDARHDGSSLPEAKALVSEGVLPKSTIQADDHARLPPVPARPATARMRPAIPRITDAIIAVGLYELVRAPDHAETRA